MAPCRGLCEINNPSAVVGGATVVNKFRGTILVNFWSDPGNKQRMDCVCLAQIYIFGGCGSVLESENRGIRRT